MKTHIWISAVGCLLLTGLATWADPLEVGEAIPGISAQDQYGNAYTFTNGTAFLLIALDMDSAKAANQELAKQGKGFLEKHNAAYLMDIHTMPGVGRFFALRKMRKYPQRIVLIETAETLSWAPSKPHHITMVKLTADGRLERTTYWNPAKTAVSEMFETP